MVDYASIRSSVSVQSAYKSAAENRASSNSVAGTESSSNESGFADLIAGAAAEAVNTVRQGDAAAIASLGGKAELQQVVEATMAMESTVQVSVALRDKLVEAYQDVMRMPI